MSASFVAVLISLAFVALAGIVSTALWLIVRERTSEAVRLYALRLVTSGMRVFAGIIVFGFAALRFLEPGSDEDPPMEEPGVVVVGTKVDTGAKRLTMI